MGSNDIEIEIFGVNCTKANRDTYIQGGGGGGGWGIKVDEEV